MYVFIYICMCATYRIGNHTLGLEISLSTTRTMIMMWVIWIIRMIIGWWVRLWNWGWVKLDGFALIATMMPHLLDLCTAVMGLYHYIFKYIILIVVVIIWLMNIGDGWSMNRCFDTVVVLKFFAQIQPEVGIFTYQTQVAGQFTERWSWLKWWVGSHMNVL